MRAIVRRFAPVFAVFCLSIPAWGQTRISEMTEIDPTTVTDRSKVLLPAADIQSASPGTSYAVGLDDVAYVSNSEVVTATGHGRIAGDVGKPLFGTDIFDDTAADEAPHWILLQYIDANTLRVIPPGGVIDIPVALIEDGASYSIATKGRSLYWDASVPRFQSTKPVDSNQKAGVVVNVLSVGASTFRAVMFADAAQMSAVSGSLEIETTADFLTMAAPANMQIVHCQGYNTSGDGGGGLFVYHTTGRTGITVDNGFYFAGAAADDYFERPSKRIARAAEWGITNSVGDATNNTTQLQAMLNSSAYVIELLPNQSMPLATTVTLSTSWKTIRGGGRQSMLLPQQTDGTACLHVNGSITHVTLQDFAIGGTGKTHNVKGIEFSSATRFVVNNVWLTSMDIGWESDAWVATISNLFITTCDTGFICSELNGANVDLRLENNNQHFDIDETSGTTIKLLAEGTPHERTSTVDECEGLTFDGVWLESIGTDNFKTVPAITIGGTTKCSEISMFGVAYFAATHEVGILVDKCDGFTIYGKGNQQEAGPVLKFGTDANNVRNHFVDSIGAGSDLHRFASPVELTTLPITNLFPDPFFDKGYRAIDNPALIVDCVLSEETSTVLPGRLKATKITADGGDTTANFLWRVPLTGPMRDLIGRTACVGMWIYAPSAYYDIGTVPTVYPYVTLTTDGTSPPTQIGYSKAQHIEDNWAFITVALNGNVPSDATYLQIRPYLQTSGVQNTVAGQYIIIGGVVVAPGNVEQFDKMRNGHIVMNDGRKECEILVKGTGVVATDMANLETAATIFNTTDNGGCLRIEGTVMIDDNVDFTTNVSVRGVEGSDPTLEYQDTAGHLSWNGNTNGITEATGGTAIDPTAANASELVVPTGTVERGEYFLVTSEDTLTGMTNSSGLTSKTIEIHQCKEIREENVSGEDYIVFDDIIVDPLTTSPKIKVLSVEDGITVEGIRFTWVGSEGLGNQSVYPAVDFRKCVNVVVRDCIWETESPNELLFMYCMDCLVTDCIIQGKRAYDTGDGYGVVVGPVNNFVFSDSIAYGNRHVFTTTAQTSGSVRYGTPRNVTIHNVHSKGNGTDDGDAAGGQAAGTGSTLVQFDSHGEGYGIVFDSCSVTLPYDAQDYPTAATRNSNRAFQSRSRGTIFKNCTVEAGGNNFVNGFLIEAEDCRIENCSMEGGWKAVEVKYDASGDTTGVDRCVVKGFTFVNTSSGQGELFRASAGDNHVITHCTMIGGGTYGSGGGESGVSLSDAGDDAPSNAIISHCLFSNLRGAGVQLEDSTVSARISFCDFDYVGWGSGYNRSCVHVEGTADATIHNCIMDKRAGNSWSVGGTTFGTGDVTVTGCNLRGYTGVGAGEEDTGFDTANSNSAALHTATSGLNWVDP